MDFLNVFKFLIGEFSRQKIDFALIGGFALQTAGVVRTTRDIDLIVLSEVSPVIKDIMLKHGYELTHESEDVMNFAGKKFELGRVDFLLAHRQYSVAMLERAYEKSVLNGNFKVKVIRPEDLIGLKVQASSNDQSRTRQDMADIEAVIRNNKGRLDLAVVREYFDLFGRGKELDEILEGIKDA